MPLRLIAPGKRKGNKYYIVKGRIDGRQYEVVTDPPTTDPRSAAEFRDTLTAAIRQRDGARPVQKTFAAAADLYIAARLPGAREAGYVKRLRDHFGTRRLGGIMQADVMAAAHILYPNRSPQTKNRQAIAPLASILHFAAENDWCGYRVVRKLPEPDPQPRRADRNVMATLIDQADDADLRRLLVLLAYQGWRISEAIAHEWERTNLDASTLLVWIPKTKRWREVPMHVETHAELLRVPEDRRKGKVLRWATTSGPRKALRALCRRAGVRFTPHSARHAFASDLNESGATEGDILKVGTWTDAKSIKRYTSVSPVHAKTVLDRLPTRGVARGKISK